VSLSPDEGDVCGINGCTGTFQILPPPFSFEGDGCSCHIAPPCGWCVSHEVRCTDCGLLPADVEIELDTLVSLDIQPVSCEPESNILRVSPELHFPLNEVFEVPDEFNGHQRGTFYYRNGSGVLRGPFMNPEEAGFDLCRRSTN
jgi:hypothetical protein